MNHSSLINAVNIYCSGIDFLSQPTELNLKFLGFSLVAQKCRLIFDRRLKVIVDYVHLKEVNFFSLSFILSSSLSHCLLVSQFLFVSTLRIYDHSFYLIFSFSLSNLHSILLSFSLCHTWFL